MSIDPGDLEPRSRSSCVAWGLTSAALAASSTVLLLTRDGSVVWVLGVTMGALGFLEAFTRWPRAEEPS